MARRLTYIAQTLTRIAGLFKELPCVMKNYFYILFFVLFFVGVNAPAHANEPRLIGTYGDWSAYMFTEGGKKVCYMASKPKKAEGNYTRRGEIFALITHRPSEGTRNVFSYIAGYPYKSGSDVSVNVDDKAFTLFTQDDTAWTPDAKTDNTLANMVKQGSKMVVRGESGRGTKTVDTFGLSGSTKAHNKISQECGR